MLKELSNALLCKGVYFSFFLVEDTGLEPATS